MAASKSRMAQRAGIAAVDPIWEEVREEAEEVVRNEPALGGFIYATILSQARLEDAVAAFDACLAVTETAWPEEWVRRVRSHRDETRAEVIRQRATN